MQIQVPRFSGWKVVWAAFLVAVFSWGVGFYGPSIFLQTLHADHGWAISTVSSAITAHFLFSAVLVTRLPRSASTIWRREGDAGGSGSLGIGYAGLGECPGVLAAFSGGLAEWVGMGRDQRGGDQRHGGAVVRERPAKGAQSRVQRSEHRRLGLHAVVGRADRTVRISHGHRHPRRGDDGRLGAGHRSTASASARSAAIGIGRRTGPARGGEVGNEPRGS